MVEPSLSGMGYLSPGTLGPWLQSWHGWPERFWSVWSELVGRTHPTTQESDLWIGLREGKKTCLFTAMIFTTKTRLHTMKSAVLSLHLPMAALWQLCTFVGAYDPKRMLCLTKGQRAGKYLLRQIFVLAAMGKCLFGVANSKIINKWFQIEFFFVFACMQWYASYFSCKKYLHLVMKLVFCILCAVCRAWSFQITCSKGGIFFVVFIVAFLVCPALSKNLCACLALTRGLQYRLQYRQISR